MDDVRPCLILPIEIISAPRIIGRYMHAGQLSNVH